MCLCAGVCVHVCECLLQCGRAVTRSVVDSSSGLLAAALSWNNNTISCVSGIVTSPHSHIHLFPSVSAPPHPSFLPYNLHWVLSLRQSTSTTSTFCHRHATRHSTYLTAYEIHIYVYIYVHIYMCSGMDLSQSCQWNFYF